MRQRYVAEKKKKKIIFSLEKCMSMATVFQELGFQEPRLCQRRHDPKGKEKKELWQFSLTLLFSFDNFFVESFLTEKTNSDTWDFTVVEVVPDTSLLLGRDLLLEPIWSKATSHREGLFCEEEKRLSYSTTVILRSKLNVAYECDRNSALFTIAENVF